MTDISNPLYSQLSGPWLTIFTPTYNRENTLPRCYESILEFNPVYSHDGTPVEFEWLIIDDGSTDGTRQLVEKWLEENRVPIRYIAYGDNRGKHHACNMSLEYARAPMMLNMDSDDAFTPNAIEVLWNAWQEIPEEKRHLFRAVTARCMDPETGKMIGTPSPHQPYYVNTADMRLKDKVKGEMCGINRVDVLKEYPFPSTGEKMSFFPEGVIYFSMGEKYLESIVDTPIRYYYRDAANAITARSSNRSAANYYLWKYQVNNQLKKYFRHSPKEMIKAAVGISMDGFNTRRGVRTILSDVSGSLNKVIVGLFMPAGYVLSLLSKRQKC